MEKGLIDKGTPHAARFRALVERGDAAELRRLVREHPEVHQMLDEPWFAFGAPAIVFAASQGNRELLLALRDASADLDSRSDWDAGAFGVLHHTCFAHPELAEELVDWGASIDVHAAAGLGRYGLLEQMLDSEPALVHQRGPDGQMPLSFSSTIEIADLLLSRGADIDARCIDHKSTAAQWLVATRPEVSRHLIERGATLDVFVAVALGDRELVARAIEEDPQSVKARLGLTGYDAVPPGSILDWSLGWWKAGGHCSPHAVADILRHSDVVELLDRHSPPEIRLLVACWAGDRATARELHERHPEIVPGLSPRDTRLLPDAAWMGRTEAVQTMLELGFDPHVVGDHDSTPLDRAAFHGFAPIIELLLESDPEPPLEKQNEFGGTPLDALAYGSVHGWRADGDYPAAARLLLNAGALTCAEMAEGAREDVATVLREHLE